MFAHVHPHERLRNIVARAVNGSSYVRSATEEGRRLLLESRRADGTLVHLRFLGVRDSESTAMPEPGAALRFAGVSTAGGLLRRFFMPRHGFAAESRVRIDAGATRIDIVCEDVEWWEDPPMAPPGTPTA